MYPLIFPLRSTLCATTLSAVFLPPPSSSSSSCCLIIIPLPVLSASLACELMITVTKSTFVYKLPLWLKHRCCCCCYCNCLLWFTELLCLSCISPSQVHSCLRVTWWPHRDPQTCSHWWLGDLAGKALPQLFKRELLCVNSGWEAGLPATIIYLYIKKSWVIYLNCSVIHQPSSFFLPFYSQIQTNVLLHLHYSN